MKKVFVSIFLSSIPKSYFNLIKVLNWFVSNLQMLLIWWLKFSLLSISIPKSLTFDTTYFLLINVYDLVSMISFVFIEDYCLKFTWIHNHAVIFKPIYCYFTFCLQNTNWIIYCFSKT